MHAHVSVLPFSLKIVRTRVTASSRALRVDAVTRIYLSTRYTILVNVCYLPSVSFIDSLGNSAYNL